jgi:hypothetical protein
VFSLTNFGDVNGADLAVGSRADLAGFKLDGIDSECVQSFLADAPSAWQTLDKQLRGFQVDLEFHQQWKIDSRTVQEAYDWTLCIDPGGSNILVLDNSSLAVTAANENYSFALRRASKDRPYMLSKVAPWSSSSDRPLFGALGYNRREFLNYEHSIWWVPCEHIIANMGPTGFEIVSAQYSDGPKGEKLAQIAFRYNGVPLTQPYFCQPETVYWAEYLPERHWAVARSGVSDLKDSGLRMRIRVDSTYQDWFGGDIFPRDIVLAYENLLDGRIFEVRHTSFGPPHPLEHSADEFYLPHYGISEAVLKTGSDSTFWWRTGLTFIAIIVLFVAIWLRSFAERHVQRN